jgi:hypothetical protein
MQNWKTAVLTLAIFGLGALAGTLVTAQIIRGRLAVVRQVTPAPPGENQEWAAKMTDNLRKQVDLSPDQSREVSAILARTHEDIQRLREKLRKDLRQRMIESDRAVERQLADPQRKRWEEIRRRRRKDQPQQPRPQPYNNRP